MENEEVKGISDDHRRKFYVASYAPISESQRCESKQLIRRELLRPRDEKVDLESKLGKSIIVTRTTAPAESGGYYCNVCDCIVKDSINYLDHINGKKHQRNLGMSMRVEKSSVEKVRMRFEANKRKKDHVESEYNLNERLQAIREEEEKIKALTKERRQRKKSRFESSHPSGIESLDTEYAFDENIESLMGFCSFGGSKKNH